MRFFKEFTIFCFNLQIREKKKAQFSFRKFFKKFLGRKWRKFFLEKYFKPEEEIFCKKFQSEFFSIKKTKKFFQIFFSE